MLLFQVKGTLSNAGYTESYGKGETDAYLIRTDSCGDTLWTRIWGGNDFDKGNFIRQLTNGNFLVVGYTRSYGSSTEGDIYLFMADSSGNVLWEKNYGGLLYDYGSSFEETENGEYIIIGSMSNFRSSFNDAQIVKIRPHVLFARIRRFIKNMVSFKKRKY